MKDRALRAGRKFALVMGLFLIGIAVFTGGRKLGEQLTFSPVQATVLAVTGKCEMSYKTGRWSRTQRLVECAEVPAIRTRYSEVEWQVRRVPLVTLAYPTADQRSVTTTVPLDKLERSTVRAGETIPVLRSPGRGSEITGAAGMRFLAFCGALFACGLLLLGMAMLAHRALEHLAAVRRAPERPPSHRVAGAQRMSGFAR
jgi:hypothetical protein